MLRVVLMMHCSDDDEFVTPVCSTGNCARPSGSARAHRSPRAISGKCSPGRRARPLCSCYGPCTCCAHAGETQLHTVVPRNHEFGIVTCSD